MSVTYECQRCAACCRWLGPVHVTSEEIDRLAKYLNLPVEDFIRQHTQLTPDRRGLMLMEHKTGACEFLDGNDCRVQPVKPHQCQGFPNLWRFQGWQQDCKAMANP
ncbi:MAG: YkgJ family cysteine cluster protein [Verrucomicrobiota bacterium]